MPIRYLVDNACYGLFYGVQARAWLMQRIVESEGRVRDIGLLCRYQSIVDFAADYVDCRRNGQPSRARGCKAFNAALLARALRQGTKGGARAITPAERHQLVLEARCGDITRVCSAIGVGRVTFYRWRDRYEVGPVQPGLFGEGSDPEDVEDLIELSWMDIAHRGRTAQACE